MRGPLLGACALLAALASLSLPSRAATQVNIAQLEQFLAAENSVQASDNAIAQRLASAELTERLTRVQLARIKARFHPGSETILVLDALADLSEFRNPPADGIPHQKSPSTAEQQKMIQSAERFATTTLSHLPDYLATETTRRFQDIPVLTRDTSAQSGLYSSGTTVREVSYRNGREVSANTLPSHTEPAAGRMESLGQFGPVLATIMMDSAHGAIRWDHWERTAAGLLAVFSYEVPQKASHYRVDFCCTATPADDGDGSYHGTPAYHGTLSIDPATGAILRVTLEAEFPQFDPQPQVKLLIEYQKVEVSGGSLICPVRSVAISNGYTFAQSRYWNNFYLNEITYTHFHRFGSTVHILENKTH